MEKTTKIKLSAQDVAIVARHLILDFPEILDVSSTTTQMFGEKRNHQWKWSTGTGCSQDS